jgi:alpha-L-fucosidase
VGIPADVREVISAGPFTDDWESLANFRVPRWYEDGKFGIFVHWGAYSVAGFGSEWYPRQMYLEGTKEFAYHRETFGDQREVGYKDLIERFRAERFDAEQWAGLFREAGAQFVVPVAEHHDGFAMYDSARSTWTAVQRGPRRDVIGELAEAVRSQWLVFGVSSHRAEHWWFFEGGMHFPSDVQDPSFASLYGPAQPESMPPNEEFLEDWLLRTCELVDRYRPQIVWFDWWIEQPVFEPYRRAFAAYYYNRAAAWGREVAINYKYDAFPPGTAVFDVERGQLSGIAPRLWQNDTAVARNSWGYVNDPDYKDPVGIVQDLVDVVSKRGALLLNVGPAPDGTIPEGDTRILRSIGSWLRANGEAIYGTRPWSRFGEGPTAVPEGSFRDTARAPFTVEDVRYTCRTGVLYATVLGRPAPGEPVRLRSLAEGEAGLRGPVTGVRLCGAGRGASPLSWSRDRGGLTVSLEGVDLGRLPPGPVVLRLEVPAER